MSDACSERACRVAIFDGFRVHTAEPYDAIRALSQSPQMTLVVWTGKAYEEVKVELWDRRFRIDMPTYEPGKK